MSPTGDSSRLAVGSYKVWALVASAPETAVIHCDASSTSPDPPALHRRSDVEAQVPRLPTPRAPRNCGIFNFSYFTLHRPKRVACWERAVSRGIQLEEHLQNLVGILTCDKRALGWGL